MRTNLVTDPTAPSAQAPKIVVPHAAALQAASPAVWFAANNALYMRATVPARGVYRYIGLNIGTASGNIQVGVLKLSGTDMRSWTKVMDSGIIACPAAGYTKISCGATTLDAGDYALFFWTDNVTVSVPHVNNANMAGTPWAANDAPGAGGVVASGTIAGWGQRSMSGMVLLGDV